MECLPFPEITVLLADPRIGNYFDTWIPQDDVDLEELKQNISSIEGLSRVTFDDDHNSLMKRWLEAPPKFVFNQCDDGFKNVEDMEFHLCALMDMLGVPYTGPGVEGLVLVRDKSIVRGAAIAMGVPVPDEVYFHEHEDFASRLPENFTYPAFAKPANASGSTGIRQTGFARNREEALLALESLRALHPNRPLLLQEFLSGRELSIGMVGNPQNGDFEIFDPVEVDYSGLDTSKYLNVQLEEFKRDGNCEFWQQVKEKRFEGLTPDEDRKLRSDVTKMFTRMRCCDFARMDFRMDARGVLKLMDVNPNCWVGGKFRLMAEWAGYSWPMVLRKIVLTAQNRFLKKNQGT